MNTQVHMQPRQTTSETLWRRELVGFLGRAAHKGAMVASIISPYEMASAVAEFDNYAVAAQSADACSQTLVLTEIKVVGEMQSIQRACLTELNRRNKVR